MPLVERINQTLFWLNYGIDDEMEDSSIFVGRLVNLFATLIVLTVLASAPIAGIGHWYSHTMQITMITLAILILFLNRRGYLEVGKVILLIIIPTIQFSSCFVLEGMMRGVAITIFPFFCFSVVAFKSYRNWALVISYLFSLMVIGVYIEGFTFNLSLLYNISIVLFGCLVGVYLFVHQIKTSSAKLKEKNKELIVKNGELEKSIAENEVNSRLLSIISHDLRGPVHSFDRLADKVSFLIKDQDYDELIELADYFEISSKRLFHNLERLLDWTKTHQQNIRIQNHEFAVDQLISKTCQSLQEVYLDKKISIHSDIASKTLIKTDPQILSIILRNILDNAMKFSAESSTISIHGSMMTDNYLIEITDQGPGFEPEILNRIKEGKLAMSKTGYGIGLQICIYLIELLHGSIDFESSEKGTRVYLQIPIAKSGIDELPALKEFSLS